MVLTGTTTIDICNSIMCVMPILIIHSDVFSCADWSIQYQYCNSNSSNSNNRSLPLCRRRITTNPQVHHPLGEASKMVQQTMETIIRTIIISIVVLISAAIAIVALLVPVCIEGSEWEERGEEQTIVQMVEIGR